MINENSSLYLTEVNFCNLNFRKEDFRIEPVQDKDMDCILAMCKEIFKEHKSIASDLLMLEFFTDISISRKALLNDKIIGCYLFNEDTIYCDNRVIFEDLGPYKNKKALLGLALALMPDYRGKGYGKQLRDLPKTMRNYDYVWGMQLKSLNNIDNWIRYGRRIVAEGESSYVTLMDIK